MPILANTDSADRDQIRAAFLPFARPDYVEGMLLGDDLDSLLSAMYLQQKFGWPVAGVYCQYTRLWPVQERLAFREKLLAGKIFAVDLDIYNVAVPSLGHHIVYLNTEDNLPGHSHTLNPNILRGFTIHRHFRRKYPLATIHFLLWLFDEKGLSPEAEMVVWLADSAFVNAQHYRENVEEWVNAYFRFPPFAALLPALHTRAFEEQLQATVLEPLSGNPLCHPGRSNYKSVHLGLNGFQCQFDNPNTQNEPLQALLDRLSTLTGWLRLDFPRHFEGFWQGKRKEARWEDVLPGGLAFGDWLEQQGVFSYAFTFKDRLNWTVI